MSGSYVPRGLILQVEDEEVMCLDAELTGGDRTARVQVTVAFRDQRGRRWAATTLVPMRLKRDTGTGGTK